MFPNICVCYFSGSLCSSRNQLSCLFYCLTQNKTKKKMSYLVILLITQQIQPFPSEFDESLFAHFHPLLILLRSTKKFVVTTGKNVYAVSGTGWYMDLFTNHSKPSLIGQKHSHCLANYSNSVLIGYPGRKLLWKLLTILYKGKPLPESPSFVFVQISTEFISNLLRRKRGFQFTKQVTMVQGDPVCRKEDCSVTNIGLVFKETKKYSDQDKLRLIKNVWKPGEVFEFPVSVECSNSKCHFVWGWLTRFPWLAYSKYLEGAFCLPCVLFGVQCGRNMNKLDKLYKSSLTL